jgi:hypothetical protein
MINLSGLSDNLFFSGDSSVANQDAAIQWYKANNISSMTIGWQVPIDPVTGAIVPYATNPQFPGKQFVGTSLTDIQAFALKASSSGLQVILKPYFIDSATASNIGAPNASNENLSAITATLGAYLPQVATAAQQAHVTAIIAGTENTVLQASSYTGWWQTAIQAMRQQYSGLIGYAATYFPFVSPYVNNFQDVHQIPFASSLDFVGADIYLPVATSGKATYAQAVAAWSQNLAAYWPATASVPSAPTSLNVLADLKAVSDSYGKPLVLTETGYPSSTIASYQPSNIGGSPDAQEQAVLAQAEFDVLKTAGSWLAGAIWFGGNGSDFGPAFNPAGALGWGLVGQPAAKIVADYVSLVGGVAQQTLAVQNEVLAILRWSDPTFGTALAAKVNQSLLTQAGAIAQTVHEAAATTSVATLAYQFFTGGTPSAAGMDYLVSPTGPNANNLNSAYYQSFSLENRYINFAVNLGKVGAGQANFLAHYGALSLSDAMTQAYTTIFGTAPAAGKVDTLLNAVVTSNGITETRAEYFAGYGLDGLTGLGTKAAMVGWLLAEAVKADLGDYVLSNDAYLTALAGGAAGFAVDLIGQYDKPAFHYVGA